MSQQTKTRLTDEERRERRRRYLKDWYIANRERQCQKAREYRAANIERKRKQDREYRIANRERIDQRVRQWHAAHPERVREIKQRHAVKPEVCQRKKEYQKKYLAANRDKKRVWEAAYYTKNLERMRAKGRNDVRIRKARKKSVQVIPFTTEQWESKVAYWGNRCWCCGGDWSEMDHVKPISAGGADMLCNLRPICKSCNSSKCAKWPYRMVIKERKSLS